MTALPEAPQPTVDAIMAALEQEARDRPSYSGWGISASSLGRDCDRELWYGLRWAGHNSEPHPGRILRIFARGNAAEDRILNDLRRAGLEVQDVDPITGKQWRFAFANGFVRGKADGRCVGVVEAPKAEHVIEIKCIKAGDWRAIKKHGLLAKKPEHWHQLHAGMHGLGIARGLYIAENADTCELLTERLHYDAEVAARMEARALRLVASDAAPSRLGDGPDRFVCRFCDHKALCHQTEAAPVFARRSCRSCLHFTFGSEGNGHCARFDQPLSAKRQGDGADCPAHRYLPDLVPGEQIDADIEAEIITYTMPDGTTWTDGASMEA